MKAVSILFAALIATLGMASFSASAADATLQTVANLNQNKAGLGGKTISAQGKVVKVNNGIMGRNFVHVQDGSGDAAKGTNNLVVTSKQTAELWVIRSPFRGCGAEPRFRHGLFLPAPDRRRYHHAEEVSPVPQAS
jgi:hypothetical protein